MNRIDQLLEIIGKHQAEIQAIQEGCSHPTPALEKTHKANTGGYDRDVYWTEFRCGLCYKFWKEDGSV